MDKNVNSNSPVDAESDSALVDFPYRLRALRKRRSLTQQELSRLCGIGISQIARYELGIREPSVSNLVKIARGLNVSVDYLLGLSDQ